MSDPGSDSSEMNRALPIAGLSKQAPKLIAAARPWLLAMAAGLAIFVSAFLAAFLKMGLSIQVIGLAMAASFLLIGIGMFGTTLKLFGPEGVFNNSQKSRLSDQILMLETRLERGESHNETDDLMKLVDLYLLTGDKMKADSMSRKLLELVEESD